MQGKTSKEILELEKELGLEHRELIGFKNIPAGGGESYEQLRDRLKSLFAEKVIGVSD